MKNTLYYKKEYKNRPFKYLCMKNTSLTNIVQLSAFLGKKYMNCQSSMQM